MSAARPSHPIGPDGIISGAEPFQLEGGSDRGLLLLHGFNDTPQSVAFLAHALRGRGWTVSVPLLPHHGRGGVDLAQHGAAQDWIAFARGEWQAFQARVPRAAICGQ